MRFDRQFAATLRRYEQFQKSNIAKRTQEVADSIDFPSKNEPGKTHEKPGNPDFSPSITQAEPTMGMD
jgi:hypothetical protein